MLLHVFCRLLFFFRNQLFLEKSFYGCIAKIVSNRLDPDQSRRFVGPDLGQNCLQSYEQTTLEGKELSINRS